MEKTMRERIAMGELYTDMGEGLPEERMRAKELAYDYNRTRPSNVAKRLALLHSIFGSVGENVWVEQGITVVYGTNTTIGNNCFINSNITLIDDYTISIGNGVAIAPNVTICATGHPVHHELRPHGVMYSLPVAIKDNVWIGTGVIICPGVTIGENSVIGAGSVVTKDIPANTIAVGNPCRVLREITDRDKEYYYHDKKIDLKDYKTLGLIQE